MVLNTIIAVKYDNYLNCNKPFAVIDYYLKTNNMSIYIEISTRIQQIDKDSIMYIILQFLNPKLFSRLCVFLSKFVDLSNLSFDKSIGIMVTAMLIKHEFAVDVQD